MRMGDHTEIASPIEGSYQSVLPYDASWNDFIGKKKASTRCHLVYPCLLLRLGIVSSRDMQCYIVVRSHANGIATVVGKTHTVFAEAGKPMYFFHEVSVTVLVGIDEGQYLTFEIMDGDTLGVSGGYMFEACEIFVWRLVKCKQKVFSVQRGGEEHTGLPPLCELRVNVRLDTNIQSVSMQTKDPNRIGFFHQKPPTKEIVRATFPTFKQTFCTYILNLSVRDVLAAHCVDPTYCNAENTAVVVKMCVSDPEEIYLDTDATHLRTIWKSLPQFRRTASETYNIACPELRVAAADLESGTDESSRLIFQLWVQGLDVKGESNCAPRLLSYSSISVAEVMSAAKNIQGDETEVCRQLAAMAVKTFEFDCKQVEDLSSSSLGSSLGAGASSSSRSDKDRERDSSAWLPSSSGKYAAGAGAESKKRQSMMRSLFKARDEQTANDSFEDELDGAVEVKSEKKTKKLMEKVVSRRRATLHEKVLLKHAFHSTRESQARLRADSASQPSKKAPRSSANNEELEDFKYGHVSFSIGLGLIELVVESGDLVYEEKLERKRQELVKAWNVNNQPEFLRAVDRQRALISRRMMDIEILRSRAYGGISPALLLDVNSCSLYHVLYKADSHDRHPNFMGSTVLDASRAVHRVLCHFLLDGDMQNLRVFAGGGVNPPSREHPSRGCDRFLAFPLCQELLMSKDRTRGALAYETTTGEEDAANVRKLTSSFFSILCGSDIEQNAADYASELLPSSLQAPLPKSLDPRGDLYFALGSQSSSALVRCPVPTSTWLQTRHLRYETDRALARGFMEACTLYEPAILNPRALLASLSDGRRQGLGQGQGQGLGFGQGQQLAFPAVSVKTSSKQLALSVLSPSPLAKGANKRSEYARDGSGVAGMNLDSEEEEGERGGEGEGTPAASARVAGRPGLRIDVHAAAAAAAPFSPASANTPASVTSAFMSSTPPSHYYYAAAAAASGRGSGRGRGSGSGKRQGGADGSSSQSATLRDKHAIESRIQCCFVGLARPKAFSPEFVYTAVPRGMTYTYGAARTYDVRALARLLEEGEGDGRDQNKKAAAAAAAAASTAEGRAKTPQREELPALPLDADAGVGAGVGVGVGLGPQRVIVWVLGRSPPPESLPQLRSVLTRHMTHADCASCLLLVVLAAEPRLELPLSEQDSLRAVTWPFRELIQLFEDVSDDVHGCASAADLQETLAGAGAVAGGTSSPVGAALGERYAARRSSERMLHSAAHNAVLAHFITWAEVVGQAFELENESVERSKFEFSLAKPAGGGDRGGDRDSGPQSRPEGSPTASRNTPLSAGLSEVMASYFPTWISEKVIGKLVAEMGANDRVNSVAELAEMKNRFDVEIRSRFVAEISDAVSEFMQGAHARRELLLSSSSSGGGGGNSRSGTGASTPPFMGNIEALPDGSYPAFANGTSNEQYEAEALHDFATGRSGGGARAEAEAEADRSSCVIA